MEEEPLTIEKFMLPRKEDDPLRKKELFEKESLDNDFMVVKPCEKKPNKVIHKGKHHKDEST